MCLFHKQALPRDRIPQAKLMVTLAVEMQLIPFVVQPLSRPAMASNLSDEKKPAEKNTTGQTIRGGLDTKHRRRRACAKVTYATVQSTVPAAVACVAACTSAQNAPTYSGEQICH